MTSKPRRRNEHRAKRGVDGSERGGRPEDSANAATPGGRLSLALVAGGLVAGMIVFVNYHPSDSVSVEKGDALWFGVLALVSALVALIADAVGARPADSGCNTVNPGCCSAVTRLDRLGERIVAFGPWFLAAWMVVAAWATCPPGAPRLAVNEIWYWFSAAAMFTAARLVCGGFGRFGAGVTARRCLIVVLAASGMNVAVHGLQQEFVGLPELRQLYLDDPESVLGEVGIPAPEGSAERMVFENRLRDGGPTGTFALANSLAGVLACTVVVGATILVRRWRAPGSRKNAKLDTGHSSTLTVPGRIAWGSVIAVCVACLIATRSRSAVAACVLGIIAALVIRFTGSTLLRSQRLFRTILLAGLVVGSLAVLAGGTIIAMGDAEFVEQAVPSLTFRFQYWRSTFELVQDSPLFGSGPGNFQSIYERYREPSAHEQIAEPHNFLVETLASGGIPGLVMLLSFGAAGCYLVARRAGCFSGGSKPIVSADSFAANPVIDTESVDGALTSRWCLIGAAISLMMVWILGSLIGLTPDTSAQAYALPVALFAGIWMWNSAPRLSPGDLRLAAGIGVATMLVHLTVAGGWTVPGVSVYVWIMLAILLPAGCIGSPEIGREGRHGLAINGTISRVLQFTPSVLVFGLLCTLYWTSLVPHQTVTLALLRATDFQQRGQPERSEALLLDAIAADPWDVEPVLHLCGLYRWRLTSAGDGVSTADLSAWRADWHAENQRLLARSGDDPAIHRLIAGAQLHVYQRYGDPSDLLSASETMARVARWGPSNQNVMAQYAAILTATGQPALARQYAKKALFLSKSGGNIERDLSRQLILPAIVVGVDARSGEIRLPASKVLANLLGQSDVIVK